MQIKVRFNLDTTARELPQGATIGDLRRNEDIKAKLGYGDNVNFLIDGVVMSDDVELPAGAEVVVETKANTKGSN